MGNLLLGRLSLFCLPLGLSVPFYISINTVFSAQSCIRATHKARIGTSWHRGLRRPVWGHQTASQSLSHKQLSIEWRAVLVVGDFFVFVTSFIWNPIKSLTRVRIPLCFAWDLVSICLWLLAIFLWLYTKTDKYLKYGKRIKWICMSYSLFFNLSPNAWL